MLRYVRSRRVRGTAEEKEGEVAEDAAEEEEVETEDMGLTRVNDQYGPQLLNVRVGTA